MMVTKNGGGASDDGAADIDDDVENIIAVMTIMISR